MAETLDPKNQYALDQALAALSYWCDIWEARNTKLKQSLTRTIVGGTTLEELRKCKHSK